MLVAHTYVYAAIGDFQTVSVRSYCYRGEFGCSIDVPYGNYVRVQGMVLAL